MLYERFQPIDAGNAFYVLDREGPWYEMDTYEKALDRARAWNYENDEMMDGRFSAV